MDVVVVVIGVISAGVTFSEHGIGVLLCLRVS